MLTEQEIEDTAARLVGAELDVIVRTLSALYVAAHNDGVRLARRRGDQRELCLFSTEVVGELTLCDRPVSGVKPGQRCRYPDSHLGACSDKPPR